MATDKETIRQRIKGTLDRLNMHGVVASVSDVTTALNRVRDEKVASAFRTLFVDLSLEDIVTAKTVIDELAAKTVVKTLESPDTFSFKAAGPTLSTTVTPTPPPPASVNKIPVQQVKKK